MKKLLVIGAGFLQSFVIKKAKEMGYTTLAVDANPDAEGFESADQHAILNIVDENACLEYARFEQIDGVLTAATEYGVLTASYIAQQMGLPGLHYDVARTLRNKYAVRKCLIDNNVDDTIQAFLITKDSDLDKIIPEIIFPVIVKPCDGSGSRGTTRVNAPDQLPQACEKAINNSRTSKALIESFIDGQEYGAESLVSQNGIQVLGIMRKWMTSPPYHAELGHAIPSGLSEEMEAKVKSYVEKAISALGINLGSVNMDIIISKDNKIHIIDIGARMGGNLIGSHIIPTGTGYDYMAAMIKTALCEPIPELKGEPKPIATKLLALSPGKVKELPNIKLIENNNNVIIEHHLKVGQIITPYRTNLDGCGYVIGCGDNMEDILSKANKALDEIDAKILRE